MKRFIILFIFFVSFGFISSQTLINIHQDLGRSVANVQVKDCNQLIKVFFEARRAPLGNRMAAALGHPVESIRKVFSRLVYKSRVGFLRVMGIFWFNSSKKSERFAYLANAAFEDNLIEVDDLRNLAVRYEKSKRVNLYFDESLQKLVIEQGDRAISNDETALFFRRFKITDPLTKQNFKLHSITQKELEILENPVINQTTLRDALTYIHVCRSYTKTAQTQCLAGLNQALLGTSTSRYIRRYIKVKSKNEGFDTRERRRAIKENLASDYNSLTKKVKEEIETKVFLNKSLRLSCQSSLKNTARRNARGKLLQMILVGEAISAGTLYYFDERHKEIDQEWVSKLGENLSYHFVSGYIHGVLTASAAGFPIKAAGVWLEEAIKDSTAAYTYSKHLNPNEERVRAEVERFLSNPDFKDELENLLKVVESEEIYYKVEQEINRYVQPGSNELSSEEREESIDQLTDVLSHLAYKEISNGVIETGDIGLDYYAFNRIWDLGYSVESMALTLATYKIMCSADSATKQNLIAAGGATLYIFNKVAAAKLYEQVRVMGLGF